MCHCFCSFALFKRFVRLSYCVCVVRGCVVYCLFCSVHVQSCPCSILRVWCFVRVASFTFLVLLNYILVTVVSIDDSGSTCRQAIVGKGR
uniref:Uncharacterized protein n=1 Tax=Ixodes ricinus TaxID=34613 RepID=A0A147BL99_IXORI